jgi:osmotically-inducible protein OsmY
MQKEHNMRIARIGQFILAAVVALTLAGCASTPQKESTGEYFDDTVLTSRVKTALLEDPVVSGLAVNVETFKGIVQLSGFVKTDAERSRAVEVAREVPGVKQVKNDILLR